MTKDPREMLDKAPMSLLQILIVGLTCALNGIDGFDVLSISFASNGIAKEWSILPVALGIVLSMELVGMTIGSIVVGAIADALGRRHTTLTCLAIMSFGMLLTTTVENTTQMLVWRVLTGLGLGGLLATINALSAEFANRKRRHLCVSIMSIGYPIGGVIGGIIASQLLVSHPWRSIFYFGAAITALFIPIFFFLVPESVQWLIRKQPENALKKVNSALRRMGHGSVDVLPEVTTEARKKSMKDLFSPGLVGMTIIVTTAYFFHVLTYYFILKWVPRVVSNIMGYSASTAGNVLVCANVGGAVGGLVFGLLTLRFSPKKLTVGTIAIGAVCIAFFGSIPSNNLLHVSLFAGLCGFFGNPGIVGMFALFAHVFPTHVRASGTGFCVGIGRGAGILSPIIVGFLLQEGFHISAVTALISIGGFIGAVILLFLKMPAGEKPA
jgi:benzoate transport